MAEEQWRPVPEFESSYEISDHGRVRRLFLFEWVAGNGTEYSLHRRNPKVLNPSPDSMGYLRLGLRKANKSWTVRVHQLVAVAFLAPAPSTDHEIHHKDGNPLNNHASNLVWVTRPEHRQLHGTLKADEIAAIRTLHGKASAEEAAERFRIHPRTVYKIWRCLKSTTL